MYLRETDSPIIKIFAYKRKYYLYDTYVNYLFEISKEEFIEIKQLQQIGISAFLRANNTSKAHNNIIMLLKKGFFKTSFVEVIEHSETKYIPYLLNRCINDMTLQVTKDCNLNCRYCSFSNNNKMDRDHEKAEMSWEIAQKCIDFLYIHSSDINNVTISFYGGEPLLNFRLIKKAVEYAESLFYSKKIDYVMTTNASILTDEMIDFLAKYNFLLTISFDGPSEIQNYHRKFFRTGKGSFDQVFANVKKIKEMYPEYFNECVLINPVVFEDEDKQMIYNYFLEEFSIPAERITLRDATMNGIDYIANRTDENYKKNTLYMLQGKLPQYVNEGLIKIYNDKTVIPYQWHHNGPCIPGLKMIFAGLNGNFYPCEKCPENDYFKIGDIYSGLIYKKIYEFSNIGKISESDCKSCWAMRFCNMCVIRCYDSDKKSVTREKKEGACKEEKEKALWFLKQYIDAKAEV